MHKVDLCAPEFDTPKSERGAQEGECVFHSIGYSSKDVQLRDALRRMKSAVGVARIVQ
jgi:hypothetical protein